MKTKYRPTMPKENSFKKKINEALAKQSRKKNTDEQKIKQPKENTENKKTIHFPKINIKLPKTNSNKKEKPEEEIPLVDKIFGKRRQNS